MAKRSRRPVSSQPPTGSTSSTTPDTGAAPTYDTELDPSQTPATGSGAATPATSRPRNRSTRAGQTRTRRAIAEPTFFEKYRALLIGGVAVVGVLIVGYFLFFANKTPTGSYVASGPKYVCDSLLTPGPSDTLPPSLPPITPAPATASPAASAPASAAASSSASGAPASAVAGGSPSASGAPSAAASAAPSPAPSAAPTAAPATAPGSPAASTTPAPAPTLRLGFTTEVLGRNHILNAGQTIEYGFCPPTSGDHYNIAGVGPIRAAVYPNSAEQPPGGWVHNLEHGWVVLLYSCKQQFGGCPSADTMAQMQQWYDQAPTPDPSKNGGACDKEVIVARFDSMNSQFAVLAWGRAMLMDTFNLDTALTFAQQWMDPGSEPEKSTC